VSVDIVIADARWAALGIETLATTATDAALSGMGLEPAAFEVSLLACDDARIAALNADFRAKAQATNVLSWPSDERGAMAEGEVPVAPQLPMDAELGDIAIAYETCVAEAAAAGKTTQDHATHLIIHATLHLLGYDHVRDGDAALMEGLEVEILGNLGISDPYSA
jgi:probable rRNA maturation factor